MLKQNYFLTIFLLCTMNIRAAAMLIKEETKTKLNFIEAVKTNKLDQVKLLIENADFDIVDTDGKKAIDYANDDIKKLIDVERDRREKRKLTTELLSLYKNVYPWMEIPRGGNGGHWEL